MWYGREGGSKSGFPGVSGGFGGVGSPRGRRARRRFNGVKRERDFVAFVAYCSGCRLNLVHLSIRKPRAGTLGSSDAYARQD